ncbi:hypothetical protein BDFB_003015 [Asbolus verrucosus]|uniref:Uncharacterized protein n=1 Tax=Asbolus verrucosus TaxID=1661398 RepID=A0A482VNW2_ASBVE|nr:hypothetical protein BDFB_003015 [Asbolus verrucosus]
METLSKIIVNRAYTKWDLINGLYELKNHLETDLKLRLIIIDSLPTILLNSNDHVKNNLYLNHLVNIMRYISVQHHVAFLITNLITTWNDGDFKNQQNLVESIACGRYWLSVPNIRLKIQKSEDQNAYTFFVVNSDSLNTKTKNNVNILLTDQGFL